MKILLANKFYYPRGGDCVYSLNLENALKRFGHEVAPFAMQHPNNQFSDWESFFPSNIEFRKPSISGYVKGLERIFLASEVRKKFRLLIDEFKPDIIHLNNIHSQLSPIIAQISRQMEIPVYWTMHDYRLLYPGATLRNRKLCKIYFPKLNTTSIRYHYKGANIINNTLVYLESLYWFRSDLASYTNIFLCPSQFMCNAMIEGGFPPEKIKLLRNFTLPPSLPDHPKTNDSYCYVGRLTPEKGILTLLEAAAQLPYPLQVIGGGPLETDLRRRYANYSHINFLGQIPSEQVQRILYNARFSVVPSEWYENAPLSIIESLSMGTPVLGTDIGGIPELIDASNGRIIPPHNIANLSEGIQELWNHPLSPNAQSYRSMYSFERHINSLLDLYTEGIA